MKNGNLSAVTWQVKSDFENNIKLINISGCDNSFKNFQVNYII